MPDLQKLYADFPGLQLALKRKRLALVPQEEAEAIEAMKATRDRMRKVHAEESKRVKKKTQRRKAGAAQRDEYRSPVVEASRERARKILEEKTNPPSAS